jgi:hypothetical protein
VAAASALACRLTISPADAQAIPKSLQEGGAEAAIKLRKNNWTVGIVGGLIDGTYMRFAGAIQYVFISRSAFSCQAPSLAFDGLDLAGLDQPTQHVATERS